VPAARKEAAKKSVTAPKRTAAKKAGPAHKQAASKKTGAPAKTRVAPPEKTTPPAQAAGAATKKSFEQVLAILRKTPAATLPSKRARLLAFVRSRVGADADVDAQAMLERLEDEGKIAIDDASYFLSKLELIRGRKKTMAQWRKRLFIATSYITADAAQRFGLPRDRTVIMGSRIEV